jgi:hypothetical protein
MNFGDLTLSATPLIDWRIIAAFGAIAIILIFVGWLRGARGGLWRALAMAGLILALLNPAAVIEDRKPLTDVALAVVDESVSMQLGQRAQRAEAALETLRQRTAGQKDLELRVVRAGGNQGAADNGTRLFEAIDRALSDVPRNRVAGVVLLTDGQVHDAPKAPERLASEGLPRPIHVLLTGEHNETDRRLVVERAPAYGIVGKPVGVTLRVDDGSAPGSTSRRVRVDIQRDGQRFQSLQLPVGTPQNVDMMLEHGGPTVFELSVEPIDGELTLDNNRAVVVVNGVRDRLRVLLVTGEPHPGERVWRNLLKSDPAVDLVHFTILRPPEAQDFTPVNELSLIAFPIRELFEVKLNEFDLIIFDRYRRRDTLAAIYLENIVRYVRNGGALLISTGPNLGTQSSLFNSPLGQIMPGVPTPITHEQGYRPMVTQLGHRHPVTADLPGAESAEPEWGRWFRQIDTEPRRGQVVMSGVNNRPLLMLDRVEKGRVAQLMSDHIWLWARKFEGGGPHSELLRRIAHWLMKEPELEENDLRAAVKGNRVEITRRSLEDDKKPVEVTMPNGTKETIPLAEGRGGRSIGSFQVTEPGLYHLTDGAKTAIAAVGALNPVELADVRTTEDVMRPAVTATGGQTLWLADGMPDVRRVRPGREAGGRDPSGRGWIGLRANGDYIVTGVASLPLFPGFALFLLGLGALVWAWRREGK